MKAVHFGAGNIGRGFVGLILHEAGYEVVFADVNAELIGHLASADSYRVTEVGPHARDWTVTGFRAIDSAADGEALIAEIATADVVTTAVGPNILRFVAPAIAAGLRARSADLGPVAVMGARTRSTRPTPSATRSRRRSATRPTPSDARSSRTRPSTASCRTRIPPRAST